MLHNILYLVEILQRNVEMIINDQIKNFEEVPFDIC